MTKYPMLFSFHDKVSGHGFLADVTAHGRALAVHEDDGSWWMYGIQPGAIAGGGNTLLEAYVDFRRTFTAVLFDSAAEAGTFWAFRDEVSRFFDETDPQSVSEWEAAVQDVRQGRITAKELAVSPTGMREERAESPRFIEIKCKQHFQPADNALDLPLAVAA